MRRKSITKRENCCEGAPGTARAEGEIHSEKGKREGEGRKRGIVVMKRRRRCEGEG